jgi:hypothetical protein
MKYNHTREEIIGVAQRMLKAAKSDEAQINMSIILDLLQSNTDGTRSEHFMKAPITLD